jgi:hypothetical protein
MTSSELIAAAYQAARRPTLEIGWTVPGAEGQITITDEIEAPEDYRTQIHRRLAEAAETRMIRHFRGVAPLEHKPLTSVTGN